MDRSELKQRLGPFQVAAGRRGFPIHDLVLEEAFPGDAATSFVVKVNAPWAVGMSAFQAIGALSEILWETTDPATRIHVFSILIREHSPEAHVSTSASR